MTDQLNSDSNTPKQGSQPLLPFPAADLDRSGLRLTRAEFSRLVGVSKQAVTEWVKSGKVSLGPDSRLDPRQAVSQLLRSSDPARLRSKILAPLVQDLGTRQRRIADLERALVAAKEGEVFAEDSAGELLSILDAFASRLRAEWAALREIDGDTAMAAITDWLDQTRMYGVDPSRVIVCSGLSSGLSGVPLPPDELENEIEALEAELDAQITKGVGNEQR